MIFKNYDLFLISWCSFFIIFTIRLIFCRSAIRGILYHLFGVSILFFLSFSGVYLQNYTNEKLKSPQQPAPANCSKLNESIPLLKQIPIKKGPHHFNPAQSFGDTLKKQNKETETIKTVLLAWIFVIISELSILVAKIICCLTNLLPTRRAAKSKNSYLSLE